MLKLHSFRNATGHELELEPGGAEVTGHFLHHIKPQRKRHAAKAPSREPRSTSFLKRTYRRACGCRFSPRQNF